MVEYEDADDAAKAVKTKQRIQIRGKELMVIFSRDQSSEFRYSKLYFQNAGTSVTDEEMTAIFKPYGEILQLKLITYHDQLTGNGFVRFAKKSLALAAIEGLSANVIWPFYFFKADYLSVSAWKAITAIS